MIERMTGRRGDGGAVLEHLAEQWAPPLLMPAALSHATKRCMVGAPRQRMWPRPSWSVLLLVIVTVPLPSGPGGARGALR